MKNYKKIPLQLFAIIILAQNSFALCSTSGGFLGISLLSETCFKCMFPLRIAGIDIVDGPMPDIEGEAGATSATICYCPIVLPPYYRIGITVSYFLPDRFIETVKDPGCMPILGTELDSDKLIAGDSTEAFKSSKHIKQQAHLSIFNILEILGMITDEVCQESESFDIAYMTEYDPMWQSDEVSAFINPEAVLFGSVFANLACIPDSISTMFFTPISPLFWCMGSWGNAYPLSGSSDGTRDYSEGNIALAGKFTYKLHREFILWDESGKYNYCSKIIAPVWTKGNYRYQVVTPVPHFIGHSVGQTGMLWSYYKNPPVPTKADNMGFILFRKRGCCAF